jgi:hypothetical protein
LVAASVPRAEQAPRERLRFVAGLLGVGVACLAVGAVVLSVLTRDLRPSADGALPVVAIAFVAVGVIVARRDPRNAVAWILIGVGGVVIVLADASLYAVLDFRLRRATLPLGKVALFIGDTFFYLAGTLLPLAILLYPDGRPPPRRWRWTLAPYLALAALSIGTAFANEAATNYGHHVRVGLDGSFSGAAPHLRGFVRGLSAVGSSGVVFGASLLIIVAWVLRQVVALRRATGERRQQLRCLTWGGAICLLGLIATIGHQGVVSVAAIAAFPIGIGIGILKYRLYEIDRLISRTLSYALLTALLAGTFIGLVALTTNVLPLSGRVSVALSTLAAAALFNPLRVRVQHLVDRRFNRARYDAQATVAAFTTRLRDAVELDAIRADLLDTVHRAVQPTHASIWIKPHEHG